MEYTTFTDFLGRTVLVRRADDAVAVAACKGGLELRYGENLSKESMLFKETGKNEKTEDFGDFVFMQYMDVA